MIYNELKQRGTEDFPIEYHYIDKNHTRYEMSAHWHSEVEIIRVLDGELEVRLNDKKYAAHAGDVIFVNPEIIHGATPKGCEYECLIFHIDFLNSATNSCRFFIESVLNNEYVIQDFNPCGQSKIGDEVENVINAMKNKSSGYKFKVIGSLYELLGAIVDNHLYKPINGHSVINGDKNIPKLKKILTYLRQNYDKQLTLTEMAQAAGMSPKYFCYFFKGMTGKTPGEYIRSFRIEKASQKLLNTDASVTEVAFSCGFNDLSYFIKTFKSIKNISPAKYRKS